MPRCRNRPQDARAEMADIEQTPAVEETARVNFRDFLELRLLKVEVPGT